jgi:predicted neuraminidase
MIYIFPRIAAILAAVVATALPLLAQNFAAPASTSTSLDLQPGLVRSEFISTNAPTKFSHGSTIVQLEDVLLCAWMGGSKDRAIDVSIWGSVNRGSGWSEPIELANGVNEKERTRLPLWNPVLFQPSKGPLILFYKQGASPETWIGMYKTSTDKGRTWSRAKKLPVGFYGPVRNKPVEANGFILCGSSVENSGWMVHLEQADEVAHWWDKSKPLNSSMEWGAIQPTILLWGQKDIQLLCRTKQGKVTQVWSNDKGKTWSPMRATELPNPNSAIDAVMTSDGTAVLVYNHSETNRGTLNIATSKDGRKWHSAYVLESDPAAEYSYPAIIEGADKLLHVTYTAKKAAIKHVVLDPAKFQLQPIIDGQWPQ